VRFFITAKVKHAYFDTRTFKRIFLHALPQQVAMARHGKTSTTEKEISMKKQAKPKTKRTQVKELAVVQQELTTDEAQKVKGGNQT
jgi:hypothetical protein